MSDEWHVRIETIHREAIIVATLRDVAKRVGVAVSTASYAMNNDPRISVQTRRKVHNAAKELNYRPSTGARNLKTRTTRTIGIFLNDLGGPFYSEIFQGVQQIVSSNGYELIACTAHQNIHMASRFLTERFLDGAILLGPSIPDDLILRVACPEFPVIVLDRELYGDSVHSVLVDNVQGAYDAVTHLIELGHRDIAYIGGPLNSYDNLKRFDGYKKAMDEHGVPIRARWNIQGGFTEHGGYMVAKVLLAQGDYPSAIFVANDEMALGVLRACEEWKVIVPDDLALVGFDDIRLAAYVRPMLTTVSQPKYEWGAMAAHTVFQCLQGGEAPDVVRLPTRLIVRESCGKSRGRPEFQS